MCMYIEGTFDTTFNININNFMEERSLEYLSVKLPIEKKG